MRARRDVLALAAVALVLVAAGTYFASRLAGEWRARDHRALQIRLDIVAESRAIAVEDWLARQFGALETLADNPALRLYMTELAREKGAIERTAQALYLRNLLLAAAEQGGFRASGGAGAVPANLRPARPGGLALIDRTGRVVAATPGLPAFEGALAHFLAAAPPAGRAFLDVEREAGGRATMAFLAPVFEVQGERDVASQVGVVVGVKEGLDELAPLLKPPGLAERSAETYLVRRRGNLLEYLSTLRDDAAPLARTRSAEDRSLLDVRAAENSGRMEIAHDYRGVEVVATARRVAGTPWVLVHKVDREEALGESETQALRLFLLVSAGIVAIVAALAGAQRHFASARAREDARRYEALAARHGAQGAFLAQVTDRAPDEILVIDAAGVCRFANPAAASALGMAPADMADKKLGALYGPGPARELMARVVAIATGGEPLGPLEEPLEDGRIGLVSFVPLQAAAGEEKRVLVIRRDISAAMRERERRERLANELVEALVSLIDRRDPYAAEHSKRVGRLARAIAEDMRLPGEIAEAVSIAGRLLNLGKLLVPPELLTKPGALAEAEAATVRDALLAGADLLANVAFDGPVVETIRQHMEKWDGAGFPNGLKGEEILLTARVVAAANAFVAMTAPRAFRPAMARGAALDAIIAQSSRAFDRRVVAALVGAVERAAP